MINKAIATCLVALVLLFAVLIANEIGRLPASIFDEHLIDLRLARVITQFNLRPLQTRRFEADPKFVLGRALFFDSILSGPRDVSCATCHLLKHGTSDGLQRSIGVLGVGFGGDRHLRHGNVEHLRNSLDLWNRDHNAVKSLFWDGRVEVLDPIKRSFRSPMGDALPRGLDNALAVQALFPLVRADEMLGKSSDRSSKDLPTEHAEQPNDLVPPARFKVEIARIAEVHRRIMKRLLGPDEHHANDWQKKYRHLFNAAYAGVTKGSYSIVEVANAIAHFEELAFATREGAWDRYLAGQRGAISKKAKLGALLFFSRGRCAVCHESPLFSDFDFHSIGVPIGVTQDLGRWRVTGNSADKHKFRTPPLRNVTKTAPYFHNGSEPTLKGAIRRHLDPLAEAGWYNDDGSFAMSLDHINSISTVLLPKIDVTDEEVDWLIAFLSSLEYEPTNMEAIVPSTVPSGLPVIYQ